MNIFIDICYLKIIDKLLLVIIVSFQYKNLCSISNQKLNVSIVKKRAKKKEKICSFFILIKYKTKPNKLQ